MEYFTKEQFEALLGSASTNSVPQRIKAATTGLGQCEESMQYCRDTRESARTALKAFGDHIEVLEAKRDEMASDLRRMGHNQLEIRKALAPLDRKIDEDRRSFRAQKALVENTEQQLTLMEVDFANSKATLRHIKEQRSWGIGKFLRSCWGVFRLFYVANRLSRPPQRGTEQNNYMPHRSR